MKKIVLTTIVTLLSLLGSNAQCPLPYKALKEFQNDTINFLAYNFDKRGGCYEGKTLEYLLTDLRMEPQSLSIGFIKKEDRFVQLTLTLTKAGNTPLYITVEWEKSYKYTPIRELLSRYDSKIWVTQHYDYMKTFLIKKVYLDDIMLYYHKSK